MSIAVERHLSVDAIVLLSATVYSGSVPFP